ncbi:hypothetical protein H0H92_012300 [Tricholoma furcatifolium]|nr:hypothetical protein H0H92_012300 [Tricholoma furcatifolium]
MYPLSVLILLLFLPQIVSRATAEEWRGRSIYQLITDRFALTPGNGIEACDPGAQTWCGGTGILWISPVNQNYDGPRTAYGDAYHGYWIADVSEITDNRFGTSDDLKALSAELHRRGLYLMVDVVVNNVMSTSATPDYSQYFFKDEEYGIDGLRIDVVKLQNWLKQETKILAISPYGIAVMKGDIISVATNIGSPPRNGTSIPVTTPYGG